MTGTPNIILSPGELRIEVTDDIQIVIPNWQSVAGYGRLEVFTIANVEEDCDEIEIDFWTSDIDLLIDALLAAKSELKKYND